MGLPRLETCCFVLDLKTGNIILGCINAVFSFILTIIMIVIAATVGTFEKEAIPEVIQNKEEAEAEAVLTGLYVMTIILVLMFLIKFFFDGLFVYGVITERAGVIKAYFIMWTVFLLLSATTFFINVPYYGAWTIVTELSYIGLNIYAILLSHSFYKQLNEREEV